MKKRIKLGFTDTNEQIARFFVNNLVLRYDIEIDNNNPDYLIFGDRNFGQNNLAYDGKNCLKIFYTGENQRPWEYNCHFALSFEHLDGPNFYRLPLYVIYDWDNQRKGIPYSKTCHRKPEDIAEKTDFCSFVVRNGGCQKRNEFFSKLNKYKNVTSAGPLFNNTGYILEYGDKAMESKLAWLPKFKFNMCFENSSWPGYTTEKLYEALVGKTIPIYWGSPTAALDFNPKAFLSWHDYGDDDKFMEAIVKLDTDDDAYREMYLQPMFAEGQENKFMNLNNFLDWFDKNVYKE